MEWRKLAPYEKKILDKMLEQEFPGRDAVARQIESSLVAQIDPGGSLQLNARTDVVAQTKYRIPVEGQCQDIDGTTIHVLLHVVDGRACELEIYKDDSSEVIKRPTADDLQVIALV